MKVPPRWRSPIIIHAARVAVVVTVIIGAIYVCVVAGFDAVDRHRLVAQIDTRLEQRLDDATRQPTTASSVANYDNAHDVDDAPVFLWKVGPNGRAVALTPGAPLMSAAAWSPADQSNEARLGAANFRLHSRHVNGAWFVVGQSLAQCRPCRIRSDRPGGRGGPGAPSRRVPGNAADRHQGGGPRRARSPPPTRVHCRCVP